MYTILTSSFNASKVEKSPEVFTASDTRTIIVLGRGSFDIKAIFFRITGFNNAVSGCVYSASGLF
jgi:hypothetical protein